MNPESVGPTPRVPLPRGPEHAAYIVDATPMKWLRKTWPGGTAPYTYTTAGQIVRLAMPSRSWVKYDPLMKRLTDRVERMRASGTLPKEFDFNLWNAEDAAAVILSTALAEKDTTFYVLNVEPTGRVWGFFRHIALSSWHPDAPRPRGEN